MATSPSTFRRIVVGTDLSLGAAAAISRAGLLPLGPGAQVTLLHVLPRNVPPALRGVLEQAARERLMKDAQRLAKSSGARVATRVVWPSRWRPYVDIIRHARTMGGDVIVVGRHGARPIRDTFIGSTAESLIRWGDIPVLLVSGRPRRAYRKPMIAISLEDAARAVVETALCVLDPHMRLIELLHSYYVPFEGFMAPHAWPGEIARYRRHLKKEALEKLGALRTSLSDLGKRWKVTLREGDPRRVAVAECGRRRADILVVGTHARSGLAHAMLGSVAQSVLRAAPCDVLVARPQRVCFEIP